MKKTIILFLFVFLVAGLNFASSIKVNSPDGGEKWIKGTSQKISWNSSGLTNLVKITLWKNGVLKGLVVKDQPANGIFNWTAGNYDGGTAPFGTDYKIKIREQGGTQFTTEDSSDKNFEIKAKFLMKLPFKKILIRPDLEVKMAQNIGSIHKDSWFNVVVKNVGKVDTTKSTSIEIMIHDWKLVESQNKTILLKTFVEEINPLKKGEWSLKIAKYVFHVPGKYSCSVYVNGGKYKTFTESNTENNRAGDSFIIK